MSVQIMTNCCRYWSTCTPDKHHTDSIGPHVFLTNFTAGHSNDIWNTQIVWGFLKLKHFATVLWNNSISNKRLKCSNWCDVLLFYDLIVFYYAVILHKSQQSCLLEEAKGNKNHWKKYVEVKKNDNINFLLFTHSYLIYISIDFHIISINVFIYWIVLLTVINTWIHMNVLSVMNWSIKIKIIL